MSKLRERIRSALERRSVPFGFGPRRDAASHRHVLVLAEADGAEAAASAVAAGADALLAPPGAVEAVAGPPTAGPSARASRRRRAPTPRR